MEKKHIITLGGLPGSGKSTVRDLLAAELGYQTFYTGGFSRQLAAERNLTLDEWNEQVANDKSLDELIDSEQMRINREEDNYVVDAHIGFHFIPDSFKVFLTVPIDISAKRILNDAQDETRIKAGDIMETYDEAVERIKGRIANHQARYKKHYDIEVYNPENFDLVLDTSDILPDEVTARIVAAYQQWLDA